MKIVLLLGAALVAQAAEDPKTAPDVPGPAPPSPVIRTWTNPTGDATFEGEYQMFRDGRVVIRRVPDGRIFRLKPEQRSAEDMVWVREQLEAVRKGRGSRYACARCRDTGVVKCPNSSCTRGTLHTYVDVPSTFYTPFGEMTVTHAVKQPIGKCSVCQGIGKVACPQCQAADARRREEQRDVQRRELEKAREDRHRMQDDINFLMRERERLKRELEEAERARTRDKDARVVKPPCSTERSP